MHIEGCVAALTRVAHCPGQDRVRCNRRMTRGTRTGAREGSMPHSAPLAVEVCTSRHSHEGAQNERMRDKPAGRKGYDDAEKEGRTLAGLSERSSIPSIQDTGRRPGSGAGCVLLEGGQDTGGTLAGDIA